MDNLLIFVNRPVRAYNNPDGRTPTDTTRGVCALQQGELQQWPNLPTKESKISNMNESRGASDPERFETDRLNDLDRIGNKRRAVAEPKQPIAFYISALLIAFGTILIVPYGKSLFSFLLLFSLAFGPLALAMLPMWFWRNSTSQFLLAFAAIAYAVWFLSVYLFVQTARDAMAVLLFGYVGPIASPFILVICGISGLLHKWTD